jgi:hypothetical protein
LISTFVDFVFNEGACAMLEPSPQPMTHIQTGADKQI